MCCVAMARTWPQAVMFDFDGVIVNSEPLHFLAFHEVLAAEKIEPKRVEKPKPPVEEEQLEEVESEDDEEDESVLEDASELGEDDDIGGVKRGEGDKEP